MPLHAGWLNMPRSHNPALQCAWEWVYGSEIVFGPIFGRGGWQTLSMHVQYFNSLESIDSTDPNQMYTKLYNNKLLIGDIVKWAYRNHPEVKWVWNHPQNMIGNHVWYMEHWRDTCVCKLPTKCLIYTLNEPSIAVYFRLKINVSKLYLPSFYQFVILNLASGSLNIDKFSN